MCVLHYVCRKNGGTASLECSVFQSTNGIYDIVSIRCSRSESSFAPFQTVRVRLYVPTILCTITKGPTIAGDPVETNTPKQTNYPNSRLGGIIMNLAVGTLIMR